MNRNVAHTELCKQILAAVGSLPGVLAGFNPCGVAKYPREYSLEEFAVPYGWPTHKGAPDLIVIVRGVYLGLEVKTGKDIQRPEQRACQRAHDMAGARYRVVRSVDEARAEVDALARRAV